MERHLHNRHECGANLGLHHSSDCLAGLSEVKGQERDRKLETARKSAIIVSDLCLASLFAWAKQLCILISIAVQITHIEKRFVQPQTVVDIPSP